MCSPLHHTSTAYSAAHPRSCLRQGRFILWIEGAVTTLLRQHGVISHPGEVCCGRSSQKENGPTLLLEDHSHGQRLSFVTVSFTLPLPLSSLSTVQCPLSQVLWAEATDKHTLRISLLHKQGRSLALFTMEGSFDPARHENAERWSSTLMKAAYDGVLPCMFQWQVT